MHARAPLESVDVDEAGWHLDVELHRVIKPRATGEDACLGFRLGLLGIPGGAGHATLLVGFLVADGRP